MSFSLANDPKFFQSVILYEVNNWKPIDEICENLRRLVSNRLIPKSCHFPELSFDSLTTLVKNMDVKDVDSIQKDQKFIRSVIFYEVHLGKEKEKTYKKLCRNIGSDSIDYPMFSHWYDRFKNRYFDLDDDSQDLKSPTFSELPVDVIGILVEKLELKEQLSFRKVSRNFRIIVDKQKPAYKTMQFYFDENCVKIKFNDQQVVYNDTGYDLVADYCLFSSILVNFLRTIKSKIIKSSDYIDTAFNDLTVALKNPKLQLESLEFEYRTFNVSSTEYVSEYKNAPKIYEKMENLLKTLNHKIPVKEFKMRTEHESHMLAILPYLKPRVLETICLLESDPKAIVEIVKIVTLDQWKHAKGVMIEECISTPIEKFLHLNRLEVTLNSISIEDLILIRDKLLTSSDFQHCKLWSEQKPSIAEIARVFDVKKQSGGAVSIRGYCPIPHSNEIFQFDINNWWIFIKRFPRYESRFFWSFDE